MNGYFGSLIRQTGLSVASWDPRSLASARGVESMGRHAEFGGVTEETVEIAAPRAEPMFDPPLPPRPPASERTESPGPSGSGPKPAEPRARESIAGRDQERGTERGGAPREPRVEKRTGLEGHVRSTVLRVPTTGAAETDSPTAGEPPGSSAVAPSDAASVEAHDTLEVGDSGSDERPSIQGVSRESRRPPESAFERGLVWHETYRLVRDWVAAAPSADELPQSIERHDVVEGPTARPAIISLGTAPAPPAAEGPAGEPSAVPEVHVSIGSISVMVEEPVTKPQAPPPTPPMRQEPAAPPDWTRRRRLYIR